MNEQSVTLIVSKLEELIVATGGKVEAFYPYCVKQAYISGISSSIFLGFAFVSFIVLMCLMLNKKITRYDVKNDEFTAQGIAIIILSFLTLVLFVAGTSGTSVLAIINPEYYGAKYLIRLFR